MKPERFHVPGSLWVERQIRKEGPSPVFICWRPDTAQGFTDTKELLRFARWPKSTPTGTALREWLVSLAAPAAAPDDRERIKAEGFGPEAHDDPTANTRMVT